MNLSIPMGAQRWRLLPSSMALACLCAALWLAQHYPLWPAVAVAFVLASAGAAFRWADRWPWLMLATVPVLGFAPWTGWITFEEIDLLVLSVAAGGYLARARIQPGAQGSSVLRPLSWTPGQALLLLAYALSLAWSVQRGWVDAGGFSFGWFQGYHEPMNSVRSVKAFFWALLLLPVWSRAARQAERGGVRFDVLLIGTMSLYLLAASAPALMERWSYTGLLNFSSDYRTTGSFWEMHVGGATLDGALAIGAPFMLAGLLRHRTPRSYAATLLIGLMAAYAVLTSFSRGLYLGLLVGALVLVLLWWRTQRAAPASGDLPRLSRLRGLALLLGLSLLTAWWLFPWGGYRVVLALMLSALALLGTRQEEGEWSRLQRGLVLASGMAIGVFLSLVCAEVAERVPKSAYVLSLVAALLCLALGQRGRRFGVLRELLMWGAWYWSLGQVAVVAWQWSGAVQLSTVTLPLLGLACMPWVTRQPGWQLEGLSWRTRSAALSVLLLGAMGVGSLLGGAYLSSRLGSVDRDMGTRTQHWRQGLALLDSTEQRWLGRGAGRFVSASFFAAGAKERAGDYRVVEREGRQALVLIAGTHTQGWGEMLRVSQRIDAPEGQVRLQAQLWAEEDLSLQAEVCNKHLLYDVGCISKAVPVKAKRGEWQSLDLALGQGKQWGGPWYAPQSVVFSLAQDSRGRTLRVTDLRLTDSSGRELLRNGSFDQDMAFWLFSSDKLHLPWHMKSLPLHVLFEQGLVGLGLWSALLATALWRVTAGAARRHPLAPALAAALLGFLVVGLFDSLVDAPRDAFVFWALSLVALGLQSPPDMMRGPARSAA